MSSEDSWLYQFPDGHYLLIEGRPMDAAFPEVDHGQGASLIARRPGGNENFYSTHPHSIDTATIALILAIADRA